MKTNQTFIGAYARQRRGNLTRPSAPTHAIESANDDRNPIDSNTAELNATAIEPACDLQSVDSSHVDESLETLARLLSQSVSVSDTFCPPSEVWVSQPEGQVIRIDRPEVSNAILQRAEPLIAPPVPTQAIPAPRSRAQEQPSKVASVAIERPQPALAPPPPIEIKQEKPAAPAESLAAAAKRPAPRWGGAIWEVDAFEIPSAVAELFFDESFFRSIAEHMGESVKEGLRSVLVTSIAAGEGRSTVAIGTAIAAAATGCRVAIVDVDLQSASQHELLRLEIETDWVTAIRQGEPLEQAAIASIEDGVTLLPLVLAGIRSTPVTPAEIDRLLVQLRGCFDLVLFDAGVISSWATSRIASVVDSSLIVRDTRRTSPSDVASAASRLRQQGVRGIGVVDNFCG